MDRIRSLAMYLPQFHRIKENDMWWGEGYTEWVAVKKAYPMFDGHYQPNIPLDNTYYDLLDKNTMIWQAETANKYGIDGFCFYHYWFGKNRAILEKPAENLLKWKDIKIPFCFCWDSGTWARTWTKLGNSWADTFEPKNVNKDDNEKNSGVLLKQNYGNEIYWKEHFYYLLPFFKDDRYIRVEGKPVFMFYSSMYMACLPRMISLWRDLAKKEKLEGLYIVVFHIPEPAADAVVFPMSFSPKVWGYDISKAYDNIPGTSIKGYDYDSVWQNFLRYKGTKLQDTLWLGTVRFDDTPRRGNNGRIYLGAEPKKFKKYYAMLVEKSIDDKNPFVFIDAWNEWGEGKYLEPDVKFGYEYLEAVRDVMALDIETLRSFNKMNSFSKYKDDNESYLYNVHNQMYRMEKYNILLENWIQLKKYSLSKWLKMNGYESVALYGFGKYGHLLYDKLKDEDVYIKYCIDKYSKEMKNREKLRVYGFEDEWPKCDLIIVTLVEFYTQIAKLIKYRSNADVMPLDELICDALSLNE